MYLLDTATFSANALTPHILPARIRNLLDTDETKALCGVSLLELAIHYRYNRLELVGSLEEFFDNGLARDITLLDITPEIAALTSRFPQGFPSDPFDRTIVSTASVMNLTLITPDKHIRDARFCSVEFYPFRPSRLS